MTVLDPRRVPIHRPYPDEVPWHLLPEAVAQSADRERMRIAKLNDEVIGVYATEPLSSHHHQITALAVVPACRRQGLGRWLLGHAIGVCESKGARQITVRCAGSPPASAAAGRDRSLSRTAQGASTNTSAAHGLLSRAGFEQRQDGYRLLLTPD